MKFLKGLSTVVLSVIMMFSVASANVFAVSTTQDGLEVSLITNKETYTKDEKITTTLSVKNTNSTDVTDVTMETVVPDGYGVIDGSVTTKHIEKLAPNETVKLKSVYNAKSTGGVSEISHKSKNDAVSSDNKVINTGDNITILAFVFLALLSSVFIALSCIKNRNNKKLLSIILAFSLVSGSSTLISFKANAVDAEKKSVDINTIIKIDNQSVSMSAKVLYGVISTKEKVCIVTFESNGGSIVEPITTKYGEVISSHQVPTKDDYVFGGWYLDQNFSKYFSFDETIDKDIVLYARWIDYKDTNDSDNDGIYDYIESYIGTDINSEDTDGDKLSDYVEIMILGTNPLNIDSDNDGIYDGDEDNDQDKLTNLEEIVANTNPLLIDTDGDILSDYDEINQYSTNPNDRDTDGDYVSDGKEIEIGTNPLLKDNIFNIFEESKESDSVKAKVEVQLSSEQVETLSIEKNKSKILFSEDIPGYIGGAYDFYVDGTFDSAQISFEFDKKLLETENFDPIIYYFNEEEQSLEPLATSLDGNIASTTVEHFSTYILINRTLYSQAFIWEDVWDSDSNYSGVNVVFVIDDSASMGEQGYNNDPYNLRLSVAGKLIDELPKDSKIGVVAFDSRIINLTNGLTEDKNLAKSYLTTQYFKSDGSYTYMYRGISEAFNMLESDDDDNVLKMVVVISDGAAHDYTLHSSTISTSQSLNIKLFTVGLGSGKGIQEVFEETLRPLAENTGGAFYLADNAYQLAGIYEDIGKKIDIETDSDEDGIPDYYEDNMIIFNGIKLNLDKYKEDTDNDGIFDGDEISLNFEYNEDKTKVLVTGKLNFDPTSEDSDGDGLYDYVPRTVNGEIVAPRDPNPLKYDGMENVWNNHIESLSKDKVPQKYNYHDKGLKFLEALPDDVCDLIVSLIVKLDDPLVDHKTIVKSIVAICRGSYVVWNFNFGMINLFTGIGELDEVVGAYILNFIHDEYNIAYHAQPETWQRKFGYNRFYDDVFDAGTEMITSKDLRFEVNDKTYALWMWKGDYWNLHSGSEIGLYEYAGIDKSTNMPLFNAIDFELPMTLNLYYYNSDKKIDTVFHWYPTVPQWWITGFNTSMKFESPIIWNKVLNRCMVTVGRIDFINHEDMFIALKNSMKYENSEYSKYFIFDDNGYTVWIMWDQATM